MFAKQRLRLCKLRLVAGKATKQRTFARLYRRRSKDSVDVAMALTGRVSRGRRLPGLKERVGVLERGGSPWKRKCCRCFNGRQERSQCSVSAPEAAIVARAMDYDAKESRRNTTAAVRSDREQPSIVRSCETPTATRR